MATLLWCVVSLIIGFIGGALVVYVAYSPRFAGKKR